MALTQAEIDIIKTEYTKDAATGAARDLPNRPWADAQAADKMDYAPLLLVGSDQAVADILNLARAQISIKNKFVASADVLEAIDSRDFETTANLRSAHVAWFEGALNQGQIRLVEDNGTDTRALGNIRRLLVNPEVQGSRTRLDAVANRQGSIAEKLLGASWQGRMITPEEVGSTR